MTHEDYQTLLEFVEGEAAHRSTAGQPELAYERDARRAVEIVAAMGFPPEQHTASGYMPELRELGNTYCGPDDRFVVSLIVGYSDADMLHDPQSMRDALKGALNLIGDTDNFDTNWYVHDRQTGRTHLYRQEEAFEDDGEIDEDPDDGELDEEDRLTATDDNEPDDGDPVAALNAAGVYLEGQGDFAKLQRRSPRFQEAVTSADAQRLLELIDAQSRHGDQCGPDCPEDCMFAPGCTHEGETGLRCGRCGARRGK